MADWSDLSDGELRSRLTQRGIPFEDAQHLVADRDELADVIDGLLKGTP